MNKGRYNRGQDRNRIKYTISVLTSDNLLIEKSTVSTFEKPRQTSLIQFGKFTTEICREHQATTKKCLTLFAVPDSQLSANPNLTRNTYY